MTLFLFCTTLLLCFCVAARACTTVVIGKDASSTGRVIVGHNEDDGGRLVNRHGYVPPCDHDPGETLPAEEGRAKIQQVRHTQGFYWSEIKSAAGGLSTADSFYNDCGVLIVSDSCADPEKNFDNSCLNEGGIGYNLRRIVAERAINARDGLKIAATLLDHYGYASGGRCYTIADADEAWMLQILGGHSYAARRVGDNEAALIPNYYTIHEVDPEDHENFLLSPDVAELALKSSDTEKGTFDFARDCQSESKRLSAGNRFRSSGGYSILMRSPFFSEGDYPFAVIPPQRISRQQVMEVLRCHYEGTPLDPASERMKFSGGAPHDTSIRRICTGTTIESFIMVFGDRPEKSVMWLSLGRPCELPYFPFHPAFGVPTTFDALGVDATKKLRDHLLPDTALISWRKDAWRSMQDFQHLFELLYQDHENEHSHRLWSFENDLSRDEEVLQAEIAALSPSENPHRIATLIKAADEKTATKTLAKIAEFQKDLRAVPVTVSPDRVSLTSDEKIGISFELEIGRTPVENSLQITLGGTSAQKAIRPTCGSLKQTASRWSFSVSANDLQKVGVTGNFDFWLGGRDTKARSFAGRFLFTFTD